MAIVVAGMTMSLDGFVADSGGSARPLYFDFADFRKSAQMAMLIEQTGAVLMGRRTFETLAQQLLDADTVRLEKLDVQKLGARTKLSFRVVR